MNYLIGLLLLGCETKVTSSVEKDMYVEGTVEDTAVEEEVVEETEEQEEQETGEIEEPVEEDTGETDTNQPESLTDFSQKGPHYPYGITKETRTVSVTDCPNMQYEVYTPYTDNPPLVILGHGFARGADVMVGWAEHLSSWGVEVLLPTLCHYNVFVGVDHEMNGQNMKELALLHGATDVVYAGHSAGGLAAIIAASQDPNASGVLGLDATDTQGIPGVPDAIGQNYAGNVACPAFSIIGEPSTCNADNNGLDLFSMMDTYQAIKVVDADHCDFESPTDWICESQCENAQTTFTDEEIRPVITTLGTAAIMSLSGLSSAEENIWINGLEEWNNSGITQEIE